MTRLALLLPILAACASSPRAPLSNLDDRQDETVEPLRWDCLAGQPPAPLPRPEVERLARHIRERCLNHDGSMRSIDAGCLTVGEAYDLSEAVGKAVVWMLSAETLCRAPVANMGGVVRR